MEHKYGFTKMTAAEFETWFANVSVSRQINIVQHHHTWAPNYSHFANHDAFTLQKNMKHHHVANNGWSDIGQHFSIFPDGSIVTGRSLNSSPACIYRNNSHSICIESVGNFDTGHDQMTTAQSDAIISATATILRRFTGIPHDEHGIVYHHWYDLNTGARRDGAGVTKSCPGTNYFGGNTVADFRANLLPLITARLTGNPPPPPPAAQPGYVVVTASALNIRTGPGTTFAKVSEHGPAQQGSVLRVYEQSASGWLRISNSHQHWVFGRYTETARPGTINTAGSNCRSGPGTTFDVVHVYEPGLVVYVVETSDRWCRTGVDEWVHDSLITFN